jgi:hypothetical protein
MDGDGLKNILKQLFYPTNDMSNNSKKIFEKYKDNKIEKIEIVREPINNKIISFINFITNNKLKLSQEKADIDTLFHLYMILYLDNNKSIVLEKNEKVTLDDKYKKEANNENMIFNVEKNISLDELFNNTLKKMGDFKFYQYNSLENNCQDFLLNILEANNLDTKELISFVKQNIEKLIQNLPSYSSKFSQFFTDLASKITEFRDLIGLGDLNEGDLNEDDFIDLNSSNIDKKKYIYHIFIDKQTGFYL